MHFKKQSFSGIVRTGFLLIILPLYIIASSGCTTTSKLYVASNKPVLSETAKEMLSKSEKSHIYYFIQSEFYKKKGDFLSAITNITKAIESDPDSVFLKKELIRLYVYTNQLPNALKTTYDQLNKTPDNVELLTILAQIKLSQDKDIETVDLYKKIIKLDPTQQSAYYLLGGIYSKMNQFDKALEVFQKLVTAFPNAFSGYYYIGRLHLVKDDLQKAEEAFIKATKLSGDSTESLNALVGIYKKSNQQEKLYSVYKKIIDISPENLKAHLGVALIYSEKKQKDEAKKRFKVISEKFSGAEISGAVVTDYLRKGIIDKALKILENVLIFKPTDNELIYLSGTCYNHIKDYRNAMNQFKKIHPDSNFFTNASLIRSFHFKETKQHNKAIDILKRAHIKKPEDTEIIFYLGTFYEESEYYNIALKYYHKGILLDDKNTNLHFRTGVIFDKQNKRELCIEKMKTVIKLDPENTNALNYLGYTYADMGKNLIEAEILIKKALSFKPGDAYITDSLGWLYFKKGDIEKATALLEKAVQMIPNDPILLEHLGDAFHKGDKSDKALELYIRSLENKTKDKEQLIIKIDRLKNSATK